jgi:hypothetical protein
MFETPSLVLYCRYEVETAKDSFLTHSEESNI